MKNNRQILLSIIIISYNATDLLIQCLQSIEKEAQSSQLKLEIIIIDNNSTLNHIQKITNFINQSSYKKNYKLKIKKDNLGFAKANNYASKFAKGKYLLFLNSDTILHHNSLTNLLTYAQKLRLCQLISPLIIDKKGNRQVQGGSFPNLLSLTNHMLGIDDLPLLNQIVPTIQKKQNQKNLTTNHRKIIRQQDWIPGTALLVKRECFQKIKGWDENIFMYGEDIDLSWRARKEYNYQSVIINNAKITHIGGASSNIQFVINQELLSYLYFWKKYYSKSNFLIAKIIILFGCLLRWIIFSIIGKRELAHIYFNAIKNILNEKYK